MKLPVVLALTFVFASLVHCEDDEESTKDCGTPCDKLYTPLCAQNSAGSWKSFTNLCNLEVYNCQRDQDFVKKADTWCELTRRHVSGKMRSTG